MAHFRTIVWLLTAFMGGMLAVLLLLESNKTIAPAATPLAPLEGSFSLQTQAGKIFTQANLGDKPSVVFFGFTNCPDICPTGLTDLTDLLAKLGPDRAWQAHRQRVHRIVQRQAPQRMPERPLVPDT